MSIIDNKKIIAGLAICLMLFTGSLLLQADNHDAASSTYVSTEDELAAAIEGAVPGSPVTIYLNNDITITKKILVLSDTVVNLQLSGHKIYMDVSGQTKTYYKTVQTADSSCYQMVLTSALGHSEGMFFPQVTWVRSAPGERFTLGIAGTLNVTGPGQFTSNSVSYRDQYSEFHTIISNNGVLNWENATAFKTNFYSSGTMNFKSGTIEDTTIGTGITPMRSTGVNNAIVTWIQAHSGLNTVKTTFSSGMTLKNVGGEQQSMVDILYDCSMDHCHMAVYGDCTIHFGPNAVHTNVDNLGWNTSGTRYVPDDLNYSDYFYFGACNQPGWSGTDTWIPLWGVMNVSIVNDSPVKCYIVQQHDTYDASAKSYEITNNQGASFLLYLQSNTGREITLSGAGISIPGQWSRNSGAAGAITVTQPITVSNGASIEASSVTVSTGSISVGEGSKLEADTLVINDVSKLSVDTGSVVNVDHATNTSGASVVEDIAEIVEDAGAGGSIGTDEEKVVFYTISYMSYSGTFISSDRWESGSDAPVLATGSNMSGLVANGKEFVGWTYTSGSIIPAEDIAIGKPLPAGSYVVYPIQKTKVTDLNKVAAIGDVGYASMTEAIEFAKDGETVRVIDGNVFGTGAGKYGTFINLDTSSKNISLLLDRSDYSGLSKVYVKNNGVTVTMDVSGLKTGYGGVLISPGSIILSGNIESGTVVLTGTTKIVDTLTVSEDATIIIQDGASLTNDGALVVLGTISAPGTGSFVNEGTVSVLGGTIEVQNTTNTGTVSTDSASMDSSPLAAIMAMKANSSQSTYTPTSSSGDEEVMIVAAVAAVAAAVCMIATMAIRRD